jgi:ectonucleotide pyrophosphatase/phosphodiesterase family member 5
MWRNGLKAFGLALLIGLTSACASLDHSAPPVVATVQKPAPLILISIDGFRADYLTRGVTPNLSALAAGGAQAAMRPSFPSLTFPNHYAMVTGLRPDRNGIVNNTMRDPRKPGVLFKMSNKEAVVDEFWWGEATPFWATAEKNGIKAATLFWPGSEAPNKGIRPSYYLPFDDKMPHEARVEQMLKWFDLPEDQRPGAFTLYYSDVDHQGHDFGPYAPETDAALTAVDASIGSLLAGLKARGLEGKVNIIIVADHGMAKHDPAKFIKLTDIVSPDDTDMLGGQVAGFDPKPGREKVVEAALLKPHDYMQCWRKSQIPARFHYGKNVRVPKIICLADVGGFLIAPSSDNWMPKPAGGSHGYDPAAPEMAALFIANGPGIKPGTQLKSFDNVDVYSLMMHLLNLKAEPHDGSFKPLKPALKD